MKTFLSIIFFVVTFTLSQNPIIAQQLKFSDLGTTVKGGTFSSYIASDGFEYKVGERIKIGIPTSNKTFAFISEGDGLLIPNTPTTIKASGSETEIKRIRVGGTKRSGYKVYFVTKDGFVGMNNYQIDFEQALATGEIVGFGMTSDQALSELKKAKDKLDLGLISQDEYDKIKVELSKYIK
jgi:hypothetical protein